MLQPISHIPSNRTTTSAARDAVLHLICTLADTALALHEFESVFDARSSGSYLVDGFVSGAKPLMQHDDLRAWPGSGLACQT
jgi:hypothetical protein